MLLKYKYININCKSVVYNQKKQLKATCKIHHFEFVCETFENVPNNSTMS